MHVVVVGNGIAGDTAAKTIKVRAPSSKVTIVSEDIHPLYSPCVFSKHLAGEVSRDRLFIGSCEEYRQLGIDHDLGKRVHQIDLSKKVLYYESSTLAYDRLILATGSEAVVPPIKGCARKGVFTFKTLQDLDRICNLLSGVGLKRVVVVGSGPIGLEVAVGLSKRGLEVCVLELLDHVMPKLLDKKPASKLRALLEQHGIQVITSEKAECIYGMDCVAGVSTGSQELACDLVCLSVGMRPRAELAQEAGIKVGLLGGVRVDAAMRTSVTDVFACGDCAETEDVVTGEPCLSLLWHTAKQQAFVAGCNLIGEQRHYQGSLNYSVLDIFGTYVVSSGHTSMDFPNGEIHVLEVEHDDSLTQVLLQDERLVGLQFIGREVSQDLGVLLGMIRGRVGLQELVPYVGVQTPAWRFPRWLQTPSCCEA